MSKLFLEAPYFFSKMFNKKDLTLPLHERINRRGELEFFRTVMKENELNLHKMAKINLELLKAYNLKEEL